MPIVVTEDLRRIAQRRISAGLTLPAMPYDRVRHSKLRQPELPAGVLRRQRLLDRIDDGQWSATLVIAPAGFGKTTLAAAWASQSPPAIWLTADEDDATLTRFWAHLHSALGNVVPGLGDLVEASLAIPHRASAAELGRILADEIADHGDEVRIVIDDMHRIPTGEVHDFLIGLLDLAPPSLRLLLTARFEPPLALDRFRLRGKINDILGEELLFTEDEVRALPASLPFDGGIGFTPDDAEVLRQQTGGWAAGLRLASLRRNVDSQASRHVRAAALDHQLLAPLLEETLAGFEPEARQILLRAALPDGFTAPLLLALGGEDVTDDVAREVLQFGRSTGISRRSTHLGGDWYEFHPLFRSLLAQKLAQSETASSLAALHERAAAWFAANAMYDAAITHHLAAGNTAAAAALIESQVQPALAREDWPSVAQWLALLPQELVEAEQQLLLAQAWMLHFRGLPRQLVDVLATLSKRLEGEDIAPDDARSLQAEMTLLRYCSLVPFQIDPSGTLAISQQIPSQIVPSHVFARGFAQTMHGIALHVAGRTHEAVAYLEGGLERAPAPIDAATIRLMIGLLWVHGQASHVREVAAVAEALDDLAGRHRLRLSAGWARRFLGDASYEQDDLEGAISHYSVIVQDHDFLHLAGVREALFGLALVYVAQGREDDAGRALRRAREIMVSANALEHLALLEAYTAYVALLTGDHNRALAWARSHEPEIDSAPLFMGLHPTVIRAVMLMVAGEDAEVADAVRILEQVAARSTGGNYGATLARVNALLSVGYLKQGDTARGLTAMRASLRGGLARGFTRTYLDLIPLFGSQMRTLAAQGLFPAALEAAIVEGVAPDQGTLTSGLGGMLTEREREVLAALFQRLTYKEIAEKLYISPATVKRHASSIYSKLGVSGRTEAIRAARSLGWQA